MPRQIPPIGKPPGSEDEDHSGGKPGEPRFVIRQNEKGAIKGPYFVLIDSDGNEVFESNVYFGGKEEEYEGFCRDGAERELKKWIEKGKIS